MACPCCCPTGKYFDCDGNASQLVIQLTRDASDGYAFDDVFLECPAVDEEIVFDLEDMPSSCYLNVERNYGTTMTIGINAPCANLVNGTLVAITGYACCFCANPCSISSCCTGASGVQHELTASGKNATRVPFFGDIDRFTATKRWKWNGDKTVSCSGVSNEIVEDTAWATGDTAGSNCGAQTQTAVCNPIAVSISFQ